MRSSSARVLSISEGSSKGGIPFSLREGLVGLSQLISNVTESYTAAIFLLQGEFLVLGGVQTLSREFVADCRIPVGSGLVGWTAENRLRVAVCPFEHDSTTLLYYSADQELKSFIAVPVLSEDSELLGVIACDSKKSYAYSKMAEKVLYDCAKQAARLIEASRALESVGRAPRIEPSLLQQALERLRDCETERALLNAACEIPEELVKRDALVVLSLAEGGFGEGTFYSQSQQGYVGSRLLELVCKHKKVICPSRKALATPSDDMQKRTFLSVPFFVLGKEAGSLNLLSAPHSGFLAGQVAVIEEVARVVGRELERIRSRDLAKSQELMGGVNSWKGFLAKAKAQLRQSRPKSGEVALVRISVTNVTAIEAAVGVENTQSVLQRLLRLIEQVAGSGALVCPIYSTQVLVLTETAAVKHFELRLKNLLKKFGKREFGLSQEALCPPALGEIVAKELGFAVSVGEGATDADIVEELCSRTLMPTTESPKKSTSGDWSF